MFDFFWKKKAKKEIVVNEEYIETLKQKHKYNKILKVIANEFNKGNQAGFLYSAYAEALEHTAKKPDYKKMIELYSRAIKADSKNMALYRQRARFEVLIGQFNQAEKDLEICLRFLRKNPEILVEAGNVKLNLHKIDEAIECFNTAIHNNPNLPEAYFARAEAELQKQEFGEAINDLSFAMAMVPESAALFEKRADMNFLAERYTDAIKDYNSAINLAPKNLNLYDKRAKTYIAKKNYNHAIADYEQILHIDKRNINAMIESANILHKYVKSSNAALSMLEMAIKVKPSNPDIYKIRAYIKADINDLKGSMADFNKAMAYSKNNNKIIAEIYSMRGELYYKQGYFEEAIKDYNVMIEKWPNVPDLYKKRANALRETGNYGAAVRDYSYIIKLVPDELDNYITLAYIYIEHMKNSALGLKVIDRAIEKFQKTYTEVYQLKGEVLFKMNKFSEAIENFKTALEINPESLEALYFKGNAEYKLGMVDAAIADYTKILEIDKQFYKAFNKRAFCYVQKKEFKLAIADYTQAITLNPDLSSAIVNRAKCKEVLKDYDGALADYNTAITLNPKNLDVYYLRGNLKQLLGDSTGALDDFSKTIKDARE